MVLKREKKRAAIEEELVHELSRFYPSPPIRSARMRKAAVGRFGSQPFPFDKFNDVRPYSQLDPKLRFMVAQTMDKRSKVMFSKFTQQTKTVSRDYAESRARTLLQNRRHVGFTYLREGLVHQTEGTFGQFAQGIGNPSPLLPSGPRA